MVNTNDLVRFSNYCFFHGLSPFVTIAYITAINEICERYNYNIKSYLRILNLLDYEYYHYLNHEIVKLTYDIIHSCFKFDTIDDVLLGKVYDIKYDNANRYLYLTDIQQIIDNIQLTKFLSIETVNSFFNKNITDYPAKLNKELSRLILLKFTNALINDADPFRVYLQEFINKKLPTITIYDEFQFRIYFLSMYLKAKDYPSLPSNLSFEFSKMKNTITDLSKPSKPTYNLITMVQNYLSDIEESALNPNVTRNNISDKITKLLHVNEQNNSIFFGMLANLRHIFERWVKCNDFAKV